MPSPVKTPVKAPASTPIPDPDRWIRTICPEQTRRHMFPRPHLPGEMNSYALPTAQQRLADAIWREIVDACEAYFLRGEAAWTGDSRAPEFAADTVEQQFVMWDEYRRDAGAMNWGGAGNAARPYAFDFTELPPAWKRAVCERAYVLCADARLEEDPEYRATFARWETARAGNFVSNDCPL